MADNSNASNITKVTIGVKEAPTSRRGSRGRGGRGRGRGEGRGRGGRVRGSGEAGGRGRGRGRSRGKSSRAAHGFPTDHERLMQLRADRQEKAKALIDCLPEDDVRQLLFGMTSVQPCLLMDVYDRSSKGGEKETSTDSSPDWCVCTHCLDMPTEVEKFCCGRDSDNCVSMMAEMDLYILDPMVLSLQQAYRNDLFALGAFLEEDASKANRHAAYRQFILWQFGRLGQGDRRVVPSCCVRKIRLSFPDPNGQYTGYRPGRLL